MKTVVRVPDPNEPNRVPDGSVEGFNGNTFYFWLGDEADEDEATDMGIVDDIGDGGSAF